MDQVNSRMDGLLHTVMSGFLQANLSTILVTYLTKVARALHRQHMGYRE
jgi:hypothetical protein